MLLCTRFFLYFTRFNLGLVLLAAGLAFLDADANIAPAAFIETPSLRAIDFCTALNPGCFFAIVHSLWLFCYPR